MAEVQRVATRQLEFGLVVGFFVFALPLLLGCIYIADRLDIVDWELWVIYALGFPIILFELGFTFHAVTAGHLRLRSLAGLPYWTRFALVALVTIAFFNAFHTAPYQSASITVTTLLAVHVLYGFALFSAARTNYAFVYRMIGLSLALAMLAYLPMLLLYLGLIGVPPETKWTFAIPGFPNVRQLAHAIVVSLAAVAGLMAFAGKATPIYRGSLLVYAVVLWAFLFWSGSRGGIAAVVVALAVTLVILPVPSKSKFIASLGATMIAGAALSLAHTPPDPNFGILNAHERSSDGDFGSGRLTIWTETIAVVKERPWLGYGAGQFKLVVAGGRFHASSPHNVVLQVLLDWGLIGATCFGALITALWARINSLSGPGIEEYFPLILAVNTLLAYSFIDTTMFHSYPIFILSTCFAVMAAAPRQPQTLPA